jgi:hypothetical protein
MAVTITDNRTVLDQGDANTAWTSTYTLTAGTTQPTPVESTVRLGGIVSTSTQNAYVTISSTDMSAGYIVYVWISHRAELDTQTNGGLMIQLGDNTNRIGFHVGGSDTLGFVHFAGPVVWQCLALDVANRGSFSSTAFAGSAGSLNVSAITQVGYAFKTLVKSVGGVENTFVDIARYFNPGTNDGAVLTITGGTSGTPGKFSEIASGDRQTGDLQAHGVVRQLGSGVYGTQGPLRFGNPTGTSSSWFEDTDSTIVFESRTFQTTKYKVVIVDNGSGTTTFKLGVKVGSGSTATGSNGCSFIAASGIGAQFDSGTDTDVTDVFIYGSTFSGFTNGITLGPNQEFIGCLVSGSGAITANGAVMVNTTVNTSTVAADASSLVWNVNTDTSGYLDNMKFTKGTNAHHAIQLGTTSPTEVTFSGIQFTGFNASNSQNDSTILVSRTSGTVTINISGGGSTPSYKSAGATVSIVASVSVAITVIDASNDPIQDAQTAIYLSSDNTQVLNTDTNASGIASTSFSGSTPADIYFRVRKSSTGSTKYIPVSGTGTITSTGFSVTVTLGVDPNA